MLANITTLTYEADRRECQHGLKRSNLNLLVVARLCSTTCRLPLTAQNLVFSIVLEETNIFLILLYNNHS